MQLTSYRRLILGALAGAALAAPSISSGCAGSFDPPSKINSLRVLAAVADKPYAAPGEEVTFTMTLHDGLTESDEAARAVQIIWLGGCFDPIGDQYFACYEQLAEVFKGFTPGSIPDEVGFGPTFTLKLPEDIITRRPKPDVGPHYGIAYVFFAACAGQVAPVLPDGSGRAPDFPLGCFDENGNRLGPDSFVPGYTQIYSFAEEDPDGDGTMTRRTNSNPEILDFLLDGASMPEDFEKIPTVKACPLTEDERRATGCAAEQSKAECQSYALAAVFDPKVAEVDPDATGLDGETLTEAVWVSYFAESGDVSPGIKLVNEAVSGFKPDVEVSWLPPAEPGLATLWAVVRDARGGSSIIERTVRVE